METELRSKLLNAQPLSGMRVAVVCDWLTCYAGSERVLEQILRLFPTADLFAVVDFLPLKARDFILHKKVRTTFIQRMPGAAKHFRGYLPLMPLAIEQHDLSSYDLVLSSCHAIAKGVLIGPDQLHISYVHSPMRYAWDFQHQYLREADLDRGITSWVARWLLHRIRLWDVRTACGVDQFIANSQFIRRRIQKTYRRDAKVIYPPVDLSTFRRTDQARQDYYFTASRMVPYKRMDLIVEAFSLMKDRKLVVIGEGPEMARVKAKAGPNVEFLGYRPTEEIVRHMQRARAFVFAAEEDFGILPVEAQACGTPVIAYGRGGARETVLDLNSPYPSGVFFHHQRTEDLIDAVQSFESNAAAFDPEAIRRNAERFSPEEFRGRFLNVVKEAVFDFNALSGNAPAFRPLETYIT